MAVLVAQGGRQTDRRAGAPSRWDSPLAQCIDKQEGGGPAALRFLACECLRRPEGAMGPSSRAGGRKSGFSQLQPRSGSGHPT